MAKQKNKTKDTDAQIAQLVSKLDSNDKRLAEAGTARTGSKLKKSYDKLKAKVEDRETRTHKLTVDFGGGAVAQISNEFINGLIRLWAEYRPTGWTAQMCIRDRPTTALSVAISPRSIRQTRWRSSDGASESR